MSAKGSRFARLVRHFTYRFVDHDLIAVEGQGYQTLVHVLALLSALSVVITVALLFKQQERDPVVSRFIRAGAHRRIGFLIHGADCGPGNYGAAGVRNSPSQTSPKLLTEGCAKQ